MKYESTLYQKLPQNATASREHPYPRFPRLVRSRARSACVFEDTAPRLSAWNFRIFLKPFVMKETEMVKIGTWIADVLDDTPVP